MGNKTGNQLRKLRKEHGLSQEKFAHEIGVSRQIISRWEKGKVTPNTNSVKKICDYYKINSDLFYNNTNNPAGTEKTNLFSRIRLKAVLKGIAVLLLLLFILYVIYSIYKYMLLKDLEDKFKEYDNWTNYHAEIRTVEEARLIGKTEIWYRDGKYKIEDINIFDNETQVTNTKWMDCETSIITEYNKDKGEYIEYKTSQKEESYKDGHLIKKYMKWVVQISEMNIGKMSILPNIIYLKNIDNKKMLKLGSMSLKFDEKNKTPEIFIDNTNEKILIKYYDIELNKVSENDVAIKRDL